MWPYEKHLRFMRNFRNNFSSLVLFYCEEDVFDLLIVKSKYSYVYIYPRY